LCSEWTEEAHAVDPMRLVLWNCSIGEPGCLALAAALNASPKAKLQSVIVLRLGACGATANSLAAILAPLQLGHEPCTSKLVAIGLANNPAISDEGISHLSQRLPQSLEELR
jgi:hypothetical protein